MELVKLVLSQMTKTDLNEYKMRKRGCKGMNKKWLSLILNVVIVFAFVLSACSSNEPSNTNGGNLQSESQTPKGGQEQETKKDPVTLRFSWWGSDARHEATLAALNKYMELNDHVKIEAEYGGFDEYEQKIKTQLAGKTAPDLMQLDQPWLYDLTTQGEMFVDLNEVSDLVDLSSFDANFLNDYATINGQLLGLPAGLNGTVATFNKDFFEKYNIPEDIQFNWDTLLEIGKRVHDESNGKDVLLNTDPNFYAELFKFYVRQKTGNQFIQDDFTLGFDQADAVEALEYLKKYLDAGVVQSFEESSAYNKKIEQHPKWFAGEFGLIINWASTIPVLKNDINFEIGVTPSIIMDGAKTTGVITRPSQIFSISKNSKHVEESAKLLNWLLNDEEAAVILGDVRGTSASSTALKALEEAGMVDPLILEATQIALATSGGAENGITNNAELLKDRIDVIQKLAYGRSTPEQAAEEMINVLNAKLQELKNNQ